MNPISAVPGAATLTLAALVVLSAFSGACARTVDSGDDLAASRVNGKAIVAAKGCANCHGSNLAGVPQFAPSLHESGVLKEYNKTSFERVMRTGITNDGTPVQKPMPIYHLKPAQADAVYAYLKSLG